VRNARPDGTNINAGCGSTEPGGLQHAVAETGAQIGLAFDGDADRVIGVDERGALVDGDQMLGALALDFRSRGRLRGDAVVATVMSNLGLRRALERDGIALVETPVGDRHVLAALEAHGLSLGGEQSGHVIFADYASTGDGLLTAVRFLSTAARRGVSVRDLAACMRRFPQVLINVEVSDRGALESADAVWGAVRAAEASLGDAGRVLVRPSGTEPLVRVMVEAESEEEASRHAETIGAEIRGALG
jgi:phosphoglucosamine mutase